jgi:uncharacterized membrane protein required for colicin V production
LHEAGEKNVNLYFWLILFASILILAGGCIRGYRRGFVKETESLVSWICAAATLVLISGLTRGSLTENISTRALAIALLIVLGVVYSLCRIVFASLHIFAGLPVIRVLDGILGIFAGLIKSFLLLYVVEHIAKIWLNL